MTGTYEFVLPGPDDAAIPWQWDAHHCPRPMPLLVQDAFDYFARAAFGMPIRFINGFLYMGMKQIPTDVRIPPSPHTDPRSSWEQHFLPLVQEQLDMIRSVDLSWSAAELADAMPAICARAGFGFGCTMMVIGDAAGRLMPLIQLLERTFGDDGVLRAMTIAGGHENDTSRLGDEIQGLAALAAASPSLVAAIRADDLDAAADTPEVATFLAELSVFLSDYGHAATTWFEIHSVPWSEDPAPVLRMIAAAIDRPANGRGESAVARREAMIAECAAALSDGDRPAFYAMIEAARDYVPIIEGRARWQVALAGSQRRPMMALGEKLVAQGALEDAQDIFHLHLSELPDAAAGRGPSPEVVAARKSVYTGWQTLTPPPWLGRPIPPEVLRRNPQTRHLWGLTVDAEAGATVIRGAAASRGTVTGRARVALRFEDAEALEPGEILVCPFTAPAWTPYFAIAAAVVTNTGGALSHAAIEAREYAIPCVVGTGNGTAVIPNGAMVSVDGTAGTVTVERD